MFLLIPFLIVSIMNFSFQNKPNPSQKLPLPKKEIQPFLADKNHNVILISECDLAVKFDKNYDISAKSENSLILEILTFNVDKFAVSIACTQGSKEFENQKDTLQNNEFYKNNESSYISINKDKQISFFPEYKGEIILGKNISIENIQTRIQYNYTFLYNAKTYMINIFTNKNDQKIENYDIKNLMFPSFSKEELQIQTNSLAPSKPNIEI